FYFRALVEISFRKLLCNSCQRYQRAEDALRAEPDHCAHGQKSNDKNQHGEWNQTIQWAKHLALVDFQNNPGLHGLYPCSLCDDRGAVRGLKLKRLRHDVRLI